MPARAFVPPSAGLRYSQLWRSLLCVISFALLSWNVSAQSQGLVRIGTYENPPKVFKDKDGRIAGFQADIAAAVMEKADLSFEFVHGTWNEGLERLRSGLIDVMVDVAYSEERARLYDFNEETVFINWAVVYTRPDLTLNSFPDLDGLTVAGMRGGIHSEGESGLLALVRQFGLAIQYLPEADYSEAFEAVRSGRADAAVVNRIFGLDQEARWNLRRSNVVFNPVAIKFAFTKGAPRSAELIPVFDRALKELKADLHSVYYRSMEEYLPGFVEKRSVLPFWVKIALPAVSAVLLLTLIFLLVLTFEIRRRKRLELALLEARDAADSANRAKSAFLANMSHEIRTPLNAVLGYAQILEADARLSADHRNFVDRIIGGGEHLLSVINDILDMSRIESGRIVLSPQPFSLRRAVGDVVPMAQSLASAKGLELKASVSEKLPDRVVGDEGKIRQIMLNLLGNAVKFTPAGSVTLSVDPLTPSQTSAAEARDRVGVRIVVDDTGIGIGSEDLQRVFEPFEQARGRSGSGEGSGLGLAISRRFARLMGGDITASSTPGYGSRFVFTAMLGLPSSDVILSPEAGDGGTEASGLLRRFGRAMGEPVVVVADDRESNRDILERMLSPLGFKVILAADGEEALRHFMETQPRIVLLDLVMPVMDGMEVLRRIRSHESQSGQRAAGILVVTASTVPEDKAKVLASGADDFLLKPLRLKDLLIPISRFVDFEPAPDGGIAPAVGEATEQNRLTRGLVDCVAALPLTERDAIAHALVIGDVGALRDAASRVNDAFPDLAQALTSAARDFDFVALEEAFGV